MSYPGYPPSGYPPQGYAQQGMPQPGYPSASGPGYPSAQPAYPMQGGMPMPDAQGGGQYPGSGYPAQPPNIGFGGAPPTAGMPTPGGDPYGAQPQQQYNASYGAAPPQGQGYPPYDQPPPPSGPGGYGAPANPGYPSQPPVASSYPDQHHGAAGQGGAYPVGQGGAYSAGQGGAYPAGQTGAYPAGQGGAYSAGQTGTYPAGQTGSNPAGQSGAYPALHGGNAPPTAALSNLSLKPREDGTVKPYSPFDAEKDAQILRKAMKGIGTDEKAIIDVLAARTNSQRLQIKLMFKTMFGKDLEKELKGELSGRFEDAVIGLMTPTADYDAQQLNKAIKGAGTDEGCLVEILCSRNNAEIHSVKESYKRLYKRDLEKDIMSDTSGHFKRLLVSLVSGGRQENMPLDRDRAKKDARDLYQAGEAKWGTDESKFNQILCIQSHVQLRQVFEEYKQVSSRTIEQAIRNEMSGDLEDGMLAVVKVVQNKPAYFAERLYKSMKGLGTDDRTLVRVMVTRCEVDMVQIKQEFQRAYGKTLQQFIQGDCSGDYKKMLMALCGP